jgi:hypothetical protein
VGVRISTQEFGRSPNIQAIAHPKFNQINQVSVYGFHERFIWKGLPATTNLRTISFYWCRN